MTPRGLDLFAGAGGCSVGFHRAGLAMYGVDNQPHGDYPFPMHLGGAVEAMRWLLDGSSLLFSGPLGSEYLTLNDFVMVTASPPCPRWSRVTPKHRRKKHPDLLAPIRELLIEWGGPYVIENVPGAPLLNPIRLCGSSFGLRVRRHRLFESNLPLFSLPCAHGPEAPVGVYGDHPDRPGGYLRPSGTSRGVKATSVAEAQAALGIDWVTTWDDLTDAIPPAMTTFIGEQLLTALEAVA